MRTNSIGSQHALMLEFAQLNWISAVRALKHLQCRLTV
jgi:hypothetical protein